jgi:hypothetical protein
LITTARVEGECVEGEQRRPNPQGRVGGIVASGGGGLELYARLPEDVRQPLFDLLCRA